MNNILTTKPKSSFRFYSEHLTYELIQKAIAEKNTNRFLQGIVSTCKANPQTCVFVVYRAFTDSVLLVFGSQPAAVIVDGDKLRSNLDGYSEKNYIYVFCHTS